MRTPAATRLPVSTQTASWTWRAAPRHARRWWPRRRRSRRRPVPRTPPAGPRPSTRGGRCTGSPPRPVRRRACRRRRRAPRGCCPPLRQRSRARIGRRQPRGASMSGETRARTAWRTSPSRFASTTRILWTPMSRSATNPSSALKRKRRAGRPGPPQRGSESTHHPRADEVVDDVLDRRPRQAGHPADLAERARPLGVQGRQHVGGVQPPQP